MDTVELNKNNLTNLWEVVSKPYDGFARDNFINYSHIKHFDWPNKIWVIHKLSSKVMNSIKSIVKNSNSKLLFVSFDSLDNTRNEFVENYEFKLKSTLPGMSLKLKDPFPESTRLNYKTVINEDLALIWSSLFEKSFGYKIDKDIVLKSMQTIRYYLAFYNEKAIGTFIMHYTGKTLGIHCLGIPAYYRGNGYAKEMMHYILNKAIQQHSAVATLQASSMAQGMYERLGFTVDFMMNTYELKTTA